MKRQLAIIGTFVAFILAGSSAAQSNESGLTSAERKEAIAYLDARCRISQER